MKLILLQDVRDLGFQFDVLEVSDAYALSTLLPRRLALVDTPFQRKRFGELLKDRTSPSV